MSRKSIERKTILITILLILLTIIFGILISYFLSEILPKIFFESTKLFRTVVVM
jgi:uncharacterized protein YneF (UPF0154 family)